MRASVVHSVHESNNPCIPMVLWEVAGDAANSNEFPPAVLVLLQDSFFSFTHKIAGNAERDARMVAERQNSTRGIKTRTSATGSVEKNGNAYFDAYPA